MRIAAIEQAVASDDVAVVRAMPNTPALVGEGAAAISGGSAACDDDLAWAERILGGVGLVVRVPEELLDAVTGLSGSGPAYVFLVAESLIDAAVDAGLPQELAAALTTQLLVGSAKLLAERGDPAALRAMVTSPGGTTAAGLRVLDERGLRQAFVEAVRAATQRSRELSAAPVSERSPRAGRSGLAGRPATMLRRRASGRRCFELEWKGFAFRSKPQRRISAMTPEMRMRARSKAIVRVVAGRMASTLLASGQLDAGVDRRTRRVVARRQQHGIAWAERQLGGGGASIEGEGVHALAVEHQPDGSGR